MSDMSKPTGRVLIGASGSAAVAMLPMFISALRGSFNGSITVLMTHTATRFLPASTVSLFADKVVTGEDPDTWAVDNHAGLTATNDVFAVLPATVNVLSAAANGAAPNLLTAAITSATSPVLFFPVMSAEMWANRAVQRNVEQLRADGHLVIDPPSGSRYDVGLARIVAGPTPPPPPAFVSAVLDQLSDPDRAS